MTFSLPRSRQQFREDLVERAANTFWQGALPALVTLQVGTDWSTLRSILISAALGGIGAVLSAGKALVARRRGVENSASLAKTI